MNRKIGISDCDHANFYEELAVFEKHGFSMELHQCRNEDDVIREMQRFSALGVQYAPMTERVLAALPELKCIVRYGVGVNNIDIKAATAHGIAVCNVPDYSIQEVAAHAFAMMMALTRKLFIMDHALREGIWSYEKSIPLFRYSEQTVGVIGIGRIGSSFAGMAHAMGCQIIAFDPAFTGGTRKAPDYIKLVSLDELLRTSDIISVHSPLETSRGLISEAEFKLMKPTAYLINVTRGGVVNEAALVKALESASIAGAACDVFEKEPPGKDNPLFKFDNFIGSPHMAWYSKQAERDLKRKLAEELVRFVNGEPLKYRLN